MADHPLSDLLPHLPTSRPYEVLRRARGSGQWVAGRFVTGEPLFITTVEQVAAMTDGDLLDIEKVGPNTVYKIRKAVAAVLGASPVSGLVPSDAMVNAVRAFVPAPCPKDAAVRAASGVLALAAATHIPMRGSDVEAWIKAKRDEYDRDGGDPFERQSWCAFDSLLDNYQLHADTGTPLDVEAVDFPGHPDA